MQVTVNELGPVSKTQAVFGNNANAYNQSNLVPIMETGSPDGGAGVSMPVTQQEYFQSPIPVSGPGSPNLAYDPNRPLSVKASGSGVQLGSRQERTNVVKDPWQDFLYNTILGASGSQDAYVPEYTKAALETFTRNPAMAAEFFPQMAAPLLEANRISQDRQMGQYNDAIRKAGGTANSVMQAGSYAQGLRSLAGDFARQDQEVLARNYIPLTAQLSENMTNNIKAGLQFPQANNVALQNLIPLATSLKPVQVDNEILSAGTSAQAMPAPAASPSWLMSNSPAMQQQLGY